MAKKRNLFKWRRLCFGMTQAQLSDITGLDQALISKVENGHFVGVSRESIERLSAFLGISIRDLPKE